MEDLPRAEILGFYEVPRAELRKKPVHYLALSGPIGWRVTAPIPESRGEGILLSLKVAMYSQIPAAAGGAADQSELTSILRSVQKAKPEAVLEKGIPLDDFAPAVWVVPFRDKILFVLSVWAASRPGPALPSRGISGAHKIDDPAARPLPQSRVAPVYPLELRGVSGEVGLELEIDPRGAVTKVGIAKGLHPYLDFAAVEAVRQWRFEPVLVNGKAVPAAFAWTFVFNPLDHHSPAAPPGPATVTPPELKTVLEGASAAMEKLIRAAPYFVCTEDIREKHRYFSPTDKPTLLKIDQDYDQKLVVGYQRTRAITVYRVNFSERMERNRFLSGYQLLGKEALIREWRVPDGSQRSAKRPPLQPSEKERFSALNPFLIAYGLLAKEAQPAFSYRGLGQGRCLGRAAWIVEAEPRDGDVSFVKKAKVWIEQAGFSILKIELAGVPFRGFDDVWREAAAFNLLPQSAIECQFGVEDGGIHYPSRTAVTIQYEMPVGLMDKIIIETSYKKYRFFSVDTEHRIL